MNLQLEPPYRRNPLLLRSISIKGDLYSNLGDICRKCENLVHLEIGEETIPFHTDGRIWDGQSTIDGLEYHVAGEDDGEDSSYEEEFHDIDVKAIAKDLHKLQILSINSGVQLQHQPVAPPVLEELTNLEQLRLCCIRPLVRCDTTRDERNLRVLAQSSTRLRILDLRGCYLKILSLGWLQTEHLTALHLFYQVPAASVLYRWAHSLQYLTLAKISRSFRSYRSCGPEKPAEELNACLGALASAEESKLQQVDLKESEVSFDAIRILILKCVKLTYLDTRNCPDLPSSHQAQLTSRAEIEALFIESGSVPVSQ